MGASAVVEGCGVGSINMEDREKGHEYYWVRKCSAIKNFAGRIL